MSRKVGPLLGSLPSGTHVFEAQFWPVMGGIWSNYQPQALPLPGLWREL